jgi:hypothetical protein
MSDKKTKAELIDHILLCRPNCIRDELERLSYEHLEEISDACVLEYLDSWCGASQ